MSFSKHIHIFCILLVKTEDFKHLQMFEFCFKGNVLNSSARFTQIFCTTAENFQCSFSPIFCFALYRLVFAGRIFHFVKTPGDDVIFLPLVNCVSYGSTYISISMSRHFGDDLKMNCFADSNCHVHIIESQNDLSCKGP